MHLISLVLLVCSSIQQKFHHVKMTCMWWPYGQYSCTHDMAKIISHVILILISKLTTYVYTTMGLLYFKGNSHQTNNSVLNLFMHCTRELKIIYDTQQFLLVNCYVWFVQVCRNGIARENVHIAISTHWFTQMVITIV